MLIQRFERPGSEGDTASPDGGPPEEEETTPRPGRRRAEEGRRVTRRRRPETEERGGGAAYEDGDPTEKTRRDAACTDGDAPRWEEQTEPRVH